MDKKNIKLNFQPEFDFYLLGIGSRENDYRLSWAINKILNINLSKDQDLEIKNPKFSDIQIFSVYSFRIEDAEEEIKLISNRCENGYLIEELKNIDYFLLFGGFEQSVVNEKQSVLKTLDEIFVVMEINPENLKSKQKFIF